MLLLPIPVCIGGFLVRVVQARETRPEGVLTSVMGGYVELTLTDETHDVRLMTRSHNQSLLRRLLLAVAALVVTAVAFSLGNLACKRLDAKLSLNQGPAWQCGGSTQFMSETFHAPSKTVTAAWRPACVILNNTGAAVLEPTVLHMLRARQQQLQSIYDWLQLADSSRAMLQRTSFSIPRVIHQVWLGKAPKPAQWFNTWRCVQRV